MGYMYAKCIYGGINAIGREYWRHKLIHESAAIGVRECFLVDDCSSYIICACPAVISRVETHSSIHRFLLLTILLYFDTCSTESKCIAKISPTSNPCALKDVGTQLNLSLICTIQHPPSL